MSEQDLSPSAVQDARAISHELSDEERAQLKTLDDSLAKLPAPQREALAAALHRGDP